MTFAVERLQWRFEAYRRMFEACAHGGVAPGRFLTLRPERLRLRFGESLRQTRVPVIFAPDLADRLAALLPASVPAAVMGTAGLDRDTLRTTLALAQLDGDLDVFEVLGFATREALLSAFGSFYARVFEEARATGGGEETAALFQLIAHSSIRNVLLHQVGASERFLGLAALVAYLADRALTAAVEQDSDGLSARLGFLLMAACSPISLMGSAAAVVNRPGNVYRTVPAVQARARQVVRELLDRPKGTDLVALRARLAAELLVDAGRRKDIERSLQAEAVRDLALLSTLTQGTELRDVAGSSAALAEALFTPLGPSQLLERLRHHPGAGTGALGRLAPLLDGARSGLGSAEERADLAATGALVLALDEVALEQGAAALAAVRPVPEAEAAEARADGRAYWFGFDDAPLYLLPRQRDEAFFFVDMKDFTRRTAAVRADAMGDFLSRRFYTPVLRMAGHINRDPRSRVEIVNLLGDAVAARGDVASLVDLSVYFLSLLEDAAEELAQGAAELHAGDDVVAEIDLELVKVQERLMVVPPGPERSALEEHRRLLREGKHQRLASALGGGLEGSAFVAYGPQATVIEVGGADLGQFRVTIAEDLNAAARGTGRTGALAQEREARRRQAEQAAGLPLRDPFRVHTAGDPELLQPTAELHNTGAALTGEALAAFRAARQKELVFRSLLLRREELATNLPGYWFPRSIEDLVIASDGRGPALAFRRAGQTIFRGLEARGGSEIWEILPVDRGFGRALSAFLGQQR